MKYDYNSNFLKSKFQNTFNNIEASEEIKDRIKIHVKDTLTYDKKQISHFRFNYKFVAVAACFVVVVFIANFNSIKAGLINIYQYFFNSVEQQYAIENKEYVVDINQKYDLQEDISIEITQIMFLNQGIDLKYKICEDTGRYDLVGCEINFIYSERNYELIQEMHARLNSGYLTSCIFENETSFEDFVGKKLKLNINVLYVDNDSNDEFYEKTIELVVTPQRIYQSKVCDEAEGEIYKDKYINIKSIQENGWYLKVEYDIYINEGFICPLLSTNKEELLFLSGSGSRDTSFELFYGLPQNQISKLNIVPVSYDEGTIDYKKLNEGKTINLNWKNMEEN